MEVEITVKQLIQYLNDPPEGLQLIDVREPEEVAIAQIKGFICFTVKSICPVVCKHSRAS